MGLPVVIHLIRAESFEIVFCMSCKEFKRLLFDFEADIFGLFIKALV